MEQVGLILMLKLFIKTGSKMVYVSIDFFFIFYDISDI